MNKVIYSLLFFLISISSFANENSLFSISFGPVQLGESRIPINLKDFAVVSKSKNSNVRAGIKPGSVQWIRTKNNLLAPRVLVGIKIHKKLSNVYLKYFGNTIIPAKKKNYYYTELYMNLFNPGDIVLYQKDRPVENLTVVSNHRMSNDDTHVIDYSCSRYQLEIKGLENEYLSVGCRMEKTGKWRKQRPRLALTWSTTNYRLLDGTTPPYTSFLNDSSPLELTMVNQVGKITKVSIKAKLPKRLHRLKTALGFGPYYLNAQKEDKAKDSKIGPAVMLYGKFDLTNTTSIRFFDAFVYRNAYFNNAGFYFAYELADAFDGRVDIVPLLGGQQLTFNFDDDQPSKNNFIYPQGFEIAYKHAFGIENYNVVYGMFLSTDSDLTYNNLWLRWGKGYFWEINYIEWEQDEIKTATFGLSVGIPFMQFL